MAITISKSKYMAGVQCLKRLYLLVQSPELGTGKSASDFARMEAGREVGKLAHQLFPGGVEVRTGNPEEAIRITQELIANPDIPAIFEASVRTRRSIRQSGHFAPPPRWTLASDRSQVISLHEGRAS